MRKGGGEMVESGIKMDCKEEQEVWEKRRKMVVKRNRKCEKVG